MQSRVVQLRASPATFHGLMDMDRRFDVGREPDAVLAFLPTKHLEDTLSAMAEVWPTSLRLGCEAAAQIADGECVEKGSLQFLWLDDPAHELSVEVLGCDLEGSLDEEAVERFHGALGEADSALLLADGVRFPQAKLLAELRRESRPPVLGLFASRPSDALEGARVFLGTEVHLSGCLLLVMKGVSMDVEVVHPFTAASPAYTVTRAAGNVAYEIDGEPATLWYRRFFSVDGQLLPLPSSALPFPLIVQGPDPARRGLYRTMTEFDESSGRVSFRGDVHVGDRIRLGLRSTASLKEAAAAASDHRPQAAILSVSLGGDLSEDEKTVAGVAEAHEILGLPLIGLSSFGEVVTDTDHGVLLHNQVMALAVLREVVS